MAVKSNPNLVVLIPAHNEQNTIMEALNGVLIQTYQPKKIIVVNDCSTDKTCEVVENASENESRIILVNNLGPKPLLRGGALNLGLRYVDEKTNIVVVFDADTILAKDCFEQIVNIFIKNENIGGVCSIAGVRPLEIDPKLNPIQRFLRRFLWRIQKIEYGSFDAERIATYNNVLILHGLCSAFDYRALKQVGGYSSEHLLEDYDLTLRIKEAGWKAIFSPKIKGYTNVPLKFGQLLRQRLRWMRGGVDVLLDHKLNRYTALDILNHLIFIVLFLAVLAFVILTSTGGWRIHFIFKLPPVLLAVVGYAASLSIS